MDSLAVCIDVSLLLNMTRKRADAQHDKEKSRMTKGHGKA